MLKGNCRKKNLTTCERKTSSHKPVSRNFTKFPEKKKRPASESPL